MEEFLLSESSDDLLRHQPKLHGDLPSFSLSSSSDNRVAPILIPGSHSPSVNLLADLKQKPRLAHRSHSAPSLFSGVKESHPSFELEPRSFRSSAPSVVTKAFIGVALYIAAGVAFYLAASPSFRCHTTFLPVDALYFSVVTLCTIGYGDIVPCSAGAKLFNCAFILVGFGVVDILLNGLVTHVLDRQEAALLDATDAGVLGSYLVDAAKGRMRVRMKVALAAAVVAGCIALGAAAARSLEGLSWVDSFYLAVTSVTTVGYGDYAFRSFKGRLFASGWLLVSTLAVARAFLYLTELRLERRSRAVAKWALHRKMTVGDLVAADLDNDGSFR